MEGPEEGSQNWDSGWRMKLVENLEVMVGQLRRVGITEIFVDGSFVEDKDHPNDRKRWSGTRGCVGGTSGSSAT